MQALEFTKLALSSAYLIRPFCAEDNRGSFIKDYNETKFRENGIDFDMKEVFYTVSKKGTLRGLHFQLNKQQAKLVRCIKGHVFDVIVDLNPKSNTFGQWQGFHLTEENQYELYVPKYFAHGYLVIEDSIVSYKCDEEFYAQGDSGIKYDDEDLAVAWPYYLIGGQENIILSEKDKQLMIFKDYCAQFK